MRPSINPRTFRRAFSLVEVALAIAILGVAVVGLIGLLPAGMNKFRKAMDTSISAQIAQRILHDAEQAEFDEVIDRLNLPPDPAGAGYCAPHFTFRAPRVKAPALRYFDDQGMEIIPKSAGSLSADEALRAVYTVNVRIAPVADLPTGADVSRAQVAQFTVQVVRSAGKIEFEDGAADDARRPERNLIKPAPGMSIFTYPALIGKNQGR